MDDVEIWLTLIYSDLEKRIKSKDFYIAGSLQDPQLAGCSLEIF